MRYILYLFTLALVFVAGMVVGNIYLPARNSSIAAAISVPDPQQTIPQLEEISLEKANRNLTVLGEALNSCPVVVKEEKDRLVAEINLLLARQDFDIKKALFELEIAKNTPGSAVTAQFAQASADYAAAQELLQNLALQLYPPEPAQQEEAQPAEAQTDSSSATEETPSKDNTPQKAETQKETPKKTDTKTENKAASNNTKTADGQTSKEVKK